MPINIKRRYAARAVGDERGTLTVAPWGSEAPFPVKRIFWISGVPQGQMRGGHAHKTCHELLYVLSGAFTLDIETADGRTLSVRMDNASDGIVVMAGEWCVLRDFAAGTVVMVMASEDYDASGYIHSHEEFLHPTATD